MTKVLYSGWTQSSLRELMPKPDEYIHSLLHTVNGTWQGANKCGDREYRQSDSYRIIYSPNTVMGGTQVTLVDMRENADEIHQRRILAAVSESAVPAGDRPAAAVS